MGGPLRNDDPPKPHAARVEVAHDEKTFFSSFYRSSVRGEIVDRVTIGPVSDLEARFHYNAIENAILRGFAHHAPMPRGPVAEAWRALQRRRGLRHLDVGSGTGHWIDFFREVLLVQESVAVEITEQMSSFMKQKYAHFPNVTVRGDDMVAGSLGTGFDYVTSIGVMFHLVDDTRWLAACRNLAAALAPGGWWIIGGDFGQHTRNVQFHHKDEFSSWRESHLGAPPNEGEVRVNKRVRSLARWVALANELGLEVVELLRSESDPALSTPENDVLILTRPG